MQGAGVVILSALLRAFGIDFGADDPLLVEGVHVAFELVGAGMAIYGRARAKGPLTATSFPTVPPAAGAATLLIAGLAAGAVLFFSGCAGMKFAGGVVTDHGSITSDGKTTEVVADWRSRGEAGEQSTTLDLRGKAKKKTPNAAAAARAALAPGVLDVRLALFAPEAVRPVQFRVTPPALRELLEDEREPWQRSRSSSRSLIAALDFRGLPGLAK